MADPEHLAILRRGVEAWNIWRSQNPHVQPDLSGADLREVDLTGSWNEVVVEMNDNSGRNELRSYHRGVNFRRANLQAADLRRVTFGELADLHAADLCRSRLEGAVIRNADLSAAQLVEAKLQDTVFHDVNLCEAELSEVVLGWTIFSHIDLSRTHGLNQVAHHGPSTIGIDSIALSNGAIPAEFLRGAGVSDTFIAYVASLIGQPIKFYSCFISYSTKDQDFADRLHADLQERGVRCWFAPHDIRAGKKVHEQIDEAIRVYDRLLLILSENSMNSEWVKTEIAHARHKELSERRQVLFPISVVPFAAIREWNCFDADTGKDSAREIREYFIPDFSSWKIHDSYQQALQRLARDLNAKENVPARSDGA